jgi:branched-chain amino acid transport system substrate-binding protein
MKRTALIATVPLVLTMVTACGSSNSSTSSSGSSGSTQSTNAPSGTTSGSTSPIKIGELVPLTGINAQWGVQLKANWDYGIQQVNKSGGINGRQLTAVPFDDAGDPSQDIVGSTKLLTQDKVNLMLGPVTDGLLAALPRFTRANMFAIGDLGVPSLTPQTMPYGFVALPSSGDVGTKMVTYAKSKGYTSAALLHDSGAQGVGASVVTEQQMKQQGITLTGVQQYDTGATDLTTQLLKLKQGNPKALIMFATSGDDVGHILLGMKQVGLNVPVVGPTGVPDETVKVAGAASLTNLVTTDWSELGTCPGQAISPKLSGFAAGQQAFDPKTFVGMNLGAGIANYDAVWIMKAAVEGSGSMSGSAMTKWLETHASAVSATLVGPPISSSATSHFLYGPSALAMIQTSEPGPDGTYTRADC